MDTVDCAVAPMSACHLLLGRPWQFDLDATHGGRSNNYSFVHKGVHHVLKPMPESDIKAAVFATSKVKKKIAAITPKPRTAFLQEGETDVSIGSPKPAASESESNYKNPNSSYVQFGSVSHSVNQKNMNKEDIILDSNTNQICPIFEKSLENIPKPRTALIREREDDEPMDHQVISKKSDENCSNVTDKFTIQFGSFLCELKESNMKKGNVVSDTSMASRLIFERTNLFKYKRKMKSKSFILIGAMHVEVPS